MAAIFVIGIVMTRYIASYEDSMNSTSRSSQEENQNPMRSALSSDSASDNDSESCTRIPTSQGDNVGVGSFRLGSAAIREAQARILQAQADREASNIPKQLIPLVEICLPPNKSLKDVEDVMDERIERVKSLFTTCTTGSLSCTDPDSTQQATGIGWIPSSEKQQKESS